MEARAESTVEEEQEAKLPVGENAARAVVMGVRQDWIWVLVFRTER